MSLILPDEMRPLNLVRDVDDDRDFLFATIKPQKLVVPDEVLLHKTPFEMPIWDQGTMGSCTSNTWLAMHDFGRKKALNGVGTFKNSARLFHYNHERIYAGTFNRDSGASMRTGGIICNKVGNIPERLFEYTGKNLYRRPTEEENKLAAENKDATFYAVRGRDQLIECLAAGYPFGLGFEVPSKFMRNPMRATGAMSDADWRSGGDGGHAVTAVGYNIPLAFFWIRNSWGTDFGMNGYFKMPFWAMEKIAYNQYTLRLIEEKIKSAA